MRDTTPFVTDIVSPPRGYPTTVTESCVKFEPYEQCYIASTSSVSMINSILLAGVKTDFSSDRNF